MKTKVRMIQISEDDDWTVGEEGYIDGYVFNGTRPYVVVVIGKRVALSMFSAIEVIPSNE